MKVEASQAYTDYTMNAFENMVILIHGITYEMYSIIYPWLL